MVQRDTNSAISNHDGGHGIDDGELIPPVTRAFWILETQSVKFRSSPFCQSFLIDVTQSTISRDDRCTAIDDKYWRNEDAIVDDSNGPYQMI
jgi:hypothetical protein